MSSNKKFRVQISPTPKSIGRFWYLRLIIKTIIKSWNIHKIMKFYPIYAHAKIKIIKIKRARS